MDPSQYCIETFEPHVNTDFLIPQEAGATIRLKLVEAKAGVPHPSVRQFSLLFRGPAEPRMEQQICHLQHAVLGELDLFLVPTGNEPDGVLYQAVFNCFVETPQNKP